MLAGTQRPLTRFAIGVLLASGFAAPAAAQVPPAADQTPSGARRPLFLSRASFYFQWAALETPDVRFRWEPRIGFDVDLLDYHRGALALTGDYDAVIGRERRRFDVNHGNYVLEMSSSLRTRYADLSAVFHHVSRHLTDRSNLPAISWNAFGARAERRVTIGKARFEGRIEASGIGQRAFVDYVWTSDLRLRYRQPITPHVEAMATASGGLVGVDRTHLGRKRLCGGWAEGGIRLLGRVAAMELFAGYERRIDAFPSDRFRVRMFSYGFRVVSH